MKRGRDKQRPKHGASLDVDRVIAARKKHREGKKRTDRNLYSLRPNKQDAEQLAKLLLAGIPFVEAMGYIDPTYPELKETQRRYCEKQWMNSRFLLDANSLLLGGEWQDIDKDRRLQLAFEKHMAELAYLLYSRSYITAEGRDVQKIDAARSALMDYLSESGTDPNSAFRRAIEDLLSGKLDGKSLYDVSKDTIAQHAVTTEES